MSNTMKKQLKRKRQKARKGSAVGARSEPSPVANLPVMPDRRAMEGILANMFGNRLRGHGGGGDVDRAQEIMYQAWESRSPQARVALARKALTMSADCADAYVLLAEEASSPGDARGLYEQGLAAGERALGTEFFEEHAGHFWGILETRPYMRARAALADVLWQTGEHEVAAAHYADLLRLNPGDNQGVRQLLVGHLIEMGRDDAAEEILAKYEDDGSAWMAYARALVGFRRAGDTPESRRRLGDAIKGNAHVPSYLLGHKKLPRALPPYHGFGDDSEAVAFAFDGIPVWRATPGALVWLSSQK